MFWHLNLNSGYSTKIYFIQTVGRVYSQPKVLAEKTNEELDL